VLLLGIEPNLRWRTFTDVIVRLASDLRVELLVTLGALLADVPHTRPSPVTGSASDPELVERLGLSASRYEGPTGIVGVLHDATSRSSSGARIPSRSRSTSPRATRSPQSSRATSASASVATAPPAARRRASSSF
jgi:hypothetical protein